MPSRLLVDPSRNAWEREHAPEGVVRGNAVRQIEGSQQVSLLRPWRAMSSQLSAQAITAQTAITRCRSGARYSGLAGRNCVALCDCDCSRVDLGPLEDDGVLLSTPFELIFADDALLPINLALDPVLKHVACLRNCRTTL
jgi:hypothetical protein